MADSAAVETDVLVVGAGPVGLTLAVDLGRRGVRCTLIEQKAAPEFLPKMERCNARTMEIFRRMGLAGRIRAAGLPADVPMDVYVILAMRGRTDIRTRWSRIPRINGLWAPMRGKTGFTSGN